MRCGKMNPPDQNYCINCGATMPKLAYKMEMASVDVVLDLYYKFADAAQKVLDGHMSLDDFDDFLADQHDKQSKFEEKIREIDIEEKDMEDFEEELEYGFTGMDKVNEGIEMMAAYLDDQDETFLDQGLEMIKQGCHFIHKAKLYNRQRDMKSSEAAEIQRIEKHMEL